MSSSITQKDLIKFFAKSKIAEQKQYTPRFDVPASVRKGDEVKLVDEARED